MKSVSSYVLILSTLLLLPINSLQRVRAELESRSIPRISLLSSHHSQQHTIPNNFAGSNFHVEDLDDAHLDLDLWSGSGLSAVELAKIAREKVRRDWELEEKTRVSNSRNPGKESEKETSQGDLKSSKVNLNKLSGYQEPGRRENPARSWKNEEEEQEQIDEDEDDEDEDGQMLQAQSSIRNSKSKAKKERPSAIQKKVISKIKKIRSNSDSDSEDSSTSFFDILSKLFSFTKHILASSFWVIKMLFKPFQYISSSVQAVIMQSYYLTLSIFLRPMLIILSPFYYVFSGFYFVLVLIPVRIIKAVVKEVYPLYIFFGIAGVLGASLGLGSAGVLWFGSLIFKDESEVNQNAEPRISMKGKERMRPRRRESVLTKSIREKREEEESRARRRNKGFKEFNEKLKDLENLELDDELDEEEEAEIGRDNWIADGNGNGHRFKLGQEEISTPNDDESSETNEENDWRRNGNDNQDGYFPNGILKNKGKAMVPSHSNSNFSSSNQDRDFKLQSNQLPACISSHSNQTPSSTSLSNSSSFSSTGSAPRGATSRGGWNHHHLNTSNSTTPTGSNSSSPISTPIGGKNFYSKGLAGHSQSLSDHL